MRVDQVNESINERNRAVRDNSGNVSKVTAQVRRQLKELSQAIESLEDRLEDAARAYHITDKEHLRRQDLVATLKGRGEKCRTLFTKTMSSGGYDDGYARNALFGQGGGGGGGGRGGVRFEDESTRGVDTRDMYQQQDQIIRDQDQGLEALRKSIAVQKRMGTAIGEELTDQNEMLDDLNEGMDQTQRRLTRETQHVVHVTEKAKAGGMFCCIILLIIAIIVVLAAL